MTAATKLLNLLVTPSVVVAVVTCGLIAAPPVAEADAARAMTGLLALPRASTTKPRITSDLSSATIGRYGTRTSVTFRVKATGTSLHYTWQHRSGSGKWKTISGAKSAGYKAKASTWKSGTKFRVVVTGKGGTAVSHTAVLTVLFPTPTPAADAAAAFGLKKLTQGVDLSAYQHTPSGKVKLKAVAAWAGDDGFAILRNGSGARPIKQKYVSTCSQKTATTGSRPVVKDCAYGVLADAVHGTKLSQGHYWFNGWISSIDPTKPELFAGGFSPEESARQFVAWLKSDGHYTKRSTDPLVLDVEAGRAWTKTYKGKTYRVSLRAWNPGEAATFLSAVKDSLTKDGYKANLYVYMSANAASRQVDGDFVWADVARMARLWVASWGTNNGRIPAAQPQVGPWADQGGWSIWQYTCNLRIAGDGVGALDADIAKAEAWTPR